MMQKQLIDLLIDPRTGESLNLQEHESDDHGNVVRGRLKSQSGDAYTVANGIPRFTVTEDEGQLQTEGSFGFKWNKRDTFSSAAMLDNHREWMVDKYGFASAQDMRDWFASRERVLDIGCGAGWSSSAFLDEEWPQDSAAEWYGMDISDAIDVAQDRLGKFPRAHFIQGDALHLPFREATFDTLFSEGVLHHTPSTEQAVKRAASLLKPEGEFLFYVYREKGAIREFTDDYIRNVIADMSGEEAWEALRPLTKLGQALADLKVEVDVPDDIPYLGIKAGKQDIQRLFYWNVAKLFWNEDLQFEENHHINFDWYHPRYAHRQTEQQVRQWCSEAGLTIVRMHEQESGYTVRAIKRAA